MKDRIYYIEDIYVYPDKEEEKEGEQFAYVLLNNPEEDSYQLERMPIDGLIRNNKNERWLEGNFVYFNPAHRDYRAFTSANNRKLARDSFSVSNNFITWVESQNFVDELNPNNYSEGNIISVNSYHVNVGHGNCSIIAIKRKVFCEVWMIDCATKEWKDKVDVFASNLEAAFDEVVKFLGFKDKSELRISKFILTHKHFDHYCGMEYLINHGYINHSTTIYSNLLYVCVSSTAKRIMELIKNNNIRVIEPSKANVAPFLQFFHPEVPVVQLKRLPKIKLPNNCRSVTNANNSSIVSYINLCGRSMVFPGDLETEGFEIMSSKRKCSPYMYFADYYCISHHGSITGHPVIKCQGANPCCNIVCCIRCKKARVILMGRDKAYPGIYDHNTVIPFWKNRLVYSEHDDHNVPIKFIELEWENNQVNFFK